MPIIQLIGIFMGNQAGYKAPVYAYMVTTKRCRNIFSRMLGSLMIFPPTISRCLKHFYTTTTAWECGWGEINEYFTIVAGAVSQLVEFSHRGYTMLYPKL